MTQKQFESLMLLQEFKVNDVTYKVVGTYPLQGIIMAEGRPMDMPLPFRFENCELVIKDELEEYLLQNFKALETDKIRRIVKREIINGLNFPTVRDIDYARAKNSSNDLHTWFIKETIRLNS